MKWTKEKDDIIRECKLMNVEEIRHELLIRTGVAPALNEIVKRAYLIGVPVMYYWR